MTNRFLVSLVVVGGIGSLVAIVAGYFFLDITAVGLLAFIAGVVLVSVLYQYAIYKLISPRHPE